MRYKETIIGFIFVIIMAGGIFSFFYFSLGDSVRGFVSDFVGKDFSVQIKSPDSTQELDHLEDETYSPGPLVKENEENGEGFLTREGIIKQTNKQRENFNREILKENYKLNEIAQIKLDDMFEGNYFAHVSPSGESVGDIAKKSTYEFLFIGDNLAKGTYRDDEDVVFAWMDSPGHRQNILNERYMEIGVAAGKGMFEDREIWMAVQVFSTPVSACPEVDESLKEEIDNKKRQIEEIVEKRRQLEEEIDNIDEKGGSLHAEKSFKYNQLGKEHDKVVTSKNKLIDEYNSQVRERRACIDNM